MVVVELRAPLSVRLRHSWPGARFSCTLDANERTDEAVGRLACFIVAEHRLRPFGRSLARSPTQTCALLEQLRNSMSESLVQTHAHNPLTHELVRACACVFGAR